MNPFSFLLVVIGLAFIGYGAKLVINGLITHHWSITQGVIIRSEALREKGNDPEINYKPKVVYRYKVNGIEYQALETSLNQWGSSSPGGIEQMIQDYGYQVGGKIWVYYDPLNPQEATLNQGIPWLMVLILVTMGAALLIMVIYPWMLGVS